MPRYVGTVRTPRDPAEVYEYLLHFDNVSEWDPSIVSAEQLGAGEPEPGSRFRIRLKFLGSESFLDYELVEARRPGRLVFRAETDAVRSLDTIEVAATPGGGSELTYDADLELKGPRRLLAPLVGAAFSANNRRAEGRLREVLAR